ncbi:MAG: ribonuclease III [Verrucomicrobia bacterium]|nr:MAG: ribonuclease III [Verrucomicrobiota bacterium]
MKTPLPPEALERRLGLRFRNPAILREALTHPSAVLNRAGAGPHNQRLEFLGDAVLELVLSAELFRRFPERDEGWLTQTRARLVRRDTLHRLARELELGKYLRLSAGEERGGGRKRASNLADAFEALLGAVYLDQGLETARGVMLELLRAELDQLAEESDPDNPKGQLQEHFQARGEPLPEYVLEETYGPDHARRFRCSVRHRGQRLAEGVGSSKKAAEAAAARKVLQRLEHGDEAPSNGAGAAGEPAG